MKEKEKEYDRLDKALSGYEGTRVSRKTSWNDIVTIVTDKKNKPFDSIKKTMEREGYVHQFSMNYPGYLVMNFKKQ